MRVANNSNRRLLLLSNSRDESGRFLQHTEQDLMAHLTGIRKLTFIPYAGVTIGWDAYTQHVREAMSGFGVDVESVHQASDPCAAVERAEAIAVGGGNTFISSRTCNARVFYRPFVNEH